MRIVLIGDFGNRSDEGMRGVCAALAEHVSASHDVITVTTKDFCTLRALPRIRGFKPDCLHYLTGPTAYGLIALKVHQKAFARQCTTIATGLRPYLPPLARRSLRLMRPDWYLAQARRWERCFGAAGSLTADLPNPVDTGKFRPVSSEEKRGLRNKYGLDTTKPIALHVGHVRANRNLDALIPLQHRGYQVVVVGSESLSGDRSVRTRLVDAGCSVITEYQRNIEEIYQLSDYYVFTVLPSHEGEFPASYDEVGCIDLPLSILEALACGLPIVTTQHDAVRYFLGSRPGIEWFDGSAESCLDALKRVDIRQSTRQFIEPFDTRAVGQRLEAIYKAVASRSPSPPEFSHVC